MGRKPLLLGLAISLLVLSCREMISDPWLTDLPADAVQVLPDSLRYLEFERATRDLPLRNDMVARDAFVVRNQVDWEKFWVLTRALTKIPAPMPLPFVDFETEMVIVVAMGKIAPPWERVAIAGVMESAGQLYVLVYRDGSNPECTLADTLGFERSPIAVALVPKRPGEPKYLVRLQPIPDCDGLERPRPG